MLTPATSSSVFAGFTAVSAVSTVRSVKDGEGSSGPISHGVPFFLGVFSHFAAFTAMLWPSMAVLSWASTSLLMPAEIRPVEVVTNAFLSWESQKCLKVTSVVYRFSFFISACRLGWWRRWPTPLFSWEKNPHLGEVSDLCGKWEPDENVLPATPKTEHKQMRMDLSWEPLDLRG